MSYGLKGKVREIVSQMNSQRETTTAAARNVSLRQYLAEKYKTGSGESLTPAHLYQELNINPNTTTVQELYSNEDNKYLMSEIIRDGVAHGMAEVQAQAGRASHAPITSEAHPNGERFVSPEFRTQPIVDGATQGAYYRDLIVDEISVPTPDVTMPRLNLKDATLRDSNEAATIEEGTITYGSKKVTIPKKAKGIKITYEAIMFNPISLVSLYFTEIGRRLGVSLTNEAVRVIVDGDQPDGSEAAAVIGVIDPTKGYQYRDLLRVWVRMGLLGRGSTSVIGNEITAVDYLDIEEVKKRQAGNPTTAVVLKTPIPTSQDLYANLRVAPNQLVFQDSMASLVMLTAMALMVETEKIVSKQIEGSYASVMTGFAKLNRNASVIVDHSLPFATNGFPLWMYPMDAD